MTLDFAWPSVVAILASVSTPAPHLADDAAAMSGILHATGYFLYVRLSLSGEVEPNPVTWLMFAYGTTLLAVIEYQSGAGWRELVLPLTCSGGAMLVAGLCIARGRMRLPRSGYETGAFVADVLLTVAYAAFWWVERGTVLSDEMRLAATFGFLICSNAATFTSFVPILASTRARPEDERGSPWVVWTFAYTFLLLATVANVRGYENSALLIYPISNMVLHCLVALLALTGVWAARERAARDLCVRDTGRVGKGLFARRAFARGEHVFTMTGRRRRYAIRTEQDSTRYENWLGIGKDLYIVLDRPFLYANHSCDPNLGMRSETDFIALRDIAAGQELTFDYSITSDEVTWRMPCKCGSSLCRGVVRGIQFLPPQTVERYQPFVNPYFQAVFMARSAPLVNDTESKAPTAAFAMHQNGGGHPRLGRSTAATAPDSVGKEE